MLTGFNLQSPSLVRVRNNQRRSRARRREYIADLERRIHDCEANGLPNRNVVPQDMIRQLEDENRKLRELLHITGVEQTLVDTHLKDDDGDPEVAGSDNLMQSSPETALENLVSVENCIRIKWPSSITDVSKVRRLDTCRPRGKHG